MLSRKVIILTFSILLLLGGCKKPPYEKALKGGFPPEKNVKVISSKCRDCHVHKDFDEETHLKEITKQYTVPTYRNTKDCRTCHYISKTLTDRIGKSPDHFYHPKTTRPQTGKR
jgi:nitrate/TMAO reductase-like tetraheme cytochrome c subunit